MPPLICRLLLAAALTTTAILAAPPSPEAFFGFRMGADRSTHEWAKVSAYMRELEKGTNRIKVIEIGKSEEGRTMLAGIIAAPETLARLEHFRQIQKRLVDPRRTSDADALKLIAEGKSVVLITSAIHATEVASVHATIEFAHRLTTGSDPKTRQILDNVILLLAPSINPDGLDLVTRWYRKTLNTPFEGTSPPELYQKYTGHDNNRDWYIFSQAETRAVVAGLHNEWHPHIVYDIHQMGPTAARIWIPPYLDPIEPNVDPLIAQMANMVGMTIAADLTAAGRKGVAVNAMYDLWTPARHYQSFHGGMRILSESASVRIASPVKVRADQLSTTSLGYNARESTWNHLEPWPGGEWKLRDIVDDELIVMESVCWQAALRREFFVRNFHQFAKNAVARREPYAFVLPAAQSDPGSARRLLETLDFGAVEVERAAADFKVGSKSYAAGSYVIRLQQPFSGFAKALLEKQKYPDLRMYPGGPPRRPYDVTAHTLPLLMGVAADTIDDQFNATLRRVREFSFTPEHPRAANIWPASDHSTWGRVNEAWRKGARVWRDPRTGDFASGAAAPAGFAEVRRPRVAIYKSHIPNMDEGWTRWIVEQSGWQYEGLGNAAIRAGNLRARFDVILFPDQSPAAIHEGYRQGSMPSEYIGGLGNEGALALKAYAEAGGTLLFFNGAGRYAAQHLHLPVKDALEGVPNSEFYCPGSLLKVSAQGASPLLAGLPREFTIWMQASPVWEPSAAKAASTVLRYSSAPVLESGWLLGEQRIAGKPALLDVPIGKGRAVLFGLRPQYRAQSYLTLKLVFNALLLSSPE